MFVRRHTSNRQRAGRVLAATGLGLTVVLGLTSPVGASTTGSGTPPAPTAPAETIPLAPSAPDGPVVPPEAPADGAIPRADLPTDAVGSSAPIPPRADVAPSAVAVVAAVALTPFETALKNSRSALAQAEVYLTNHQYDWAGQSLSSLRASLNRAHALGMAHIGPVKVAEIFRFEHRIVMRLLPFYDGLTDATTLASLQSTLMTTFADRVAMMDKVAAADPEGPFDYTDGLADTVPLYNSAAKAYRAAVAQFQLTPEARTALIACRARVLAFQARFTAKFGGGE